MAMAGVGIERDIGDNADIWRGLFHGADGAAHQICAIAGFRALNMCTDLVDGT